MHKIYLLILILFTACIGNNAEDVEGKVLSVADGDSFTMLIDGKKTGVRLYGIDCPEKGQAFGNVAKKYTNSKIYNQKVRLEVKDTDQYKRLVAIVYYGNENSNLNQELLYNGLAWHYKQYSSSKEFRDLEQEAKANKRGLWVDEKPIEPWNFRKDKRER